MDYNNTTESQQLWAPWRMELINSPKSECFFCDDIATPEHDKENLILQRKQHCFVIMNRYPYSNGHLMVVPFQHTSNMEDIPSVAYTEIMETVVQWQSILKKEVHAQGFNIGINIGSVAGAGVAGHIHVHIVPRWLGDTNFMPVLGNAKVINQALDELYNKLLKYIVQ